MVLLGSLAFYVDSAMGVFELWLGVHAIFSGYLIPLEVLPGLGARKLAACCRSASCWRSRSRRWSACCRPRQALRQLGGAVALRGGAASLALRGLARGRPPLRGLRRLRVAVARAKPLGFVARYARLLRVQLRHVGAGGDAVPRRLRGARPDRVPLVGADADPAAGRVRRARAGRRLVVRRGAGGGRPGSRCCARCWRARSAPA